MRKMLVAATAAILVGVGAPAAPAQSHHGVEIREDAFAPDYLEVRVGDGVAWLNQSEGPHSVTSDDGTFDSGPLDPGQRFEIRFEAEGTYPYRSTAEGDEGMVGVVIVVPVDHDASAGGSPPTGPEETGPSGEVDPADAGSRSRLKASSSDVVMGQAAGVSIQDDVFVPRSVEVEAGGTVVWEHVGQRPHTVTASDGSFDSGTLETGASFSRTFSEPGTYSYYCRFHGTAGGAGMSGVIVVAGETTAEAPPDGAEGEAPGLAATGTSLLLPVGVATAFLGAGLWSLNLVRRKAGPE
jgi:plastocyanin